MKRQRDGQETPYITEVARMMGLHLVKTMTEDFSARGGGRGNEGSVGEES